MVHEHSPSYMLEHHSCARVSAQPDEIGNLAETDVAKGQNNAFSSLHGAKRDWDQRNIGL
jgi:hypothetical protein